MPASETHGRTTVACLFFIFLVPLAAAGLALMNVGPGAFAQRRPHDDGLALRAGRRRNRLLSFVDLRGRDCRRAGSFVDVSGKSWNWIAAEPFFFRKLSFDGSPASLTALFQIFCVGLAALIPLGSGADRWRLRASCLSTGMLAAFTYPLFAHWVWGGGWLAQLGANYGIGRGFLDVGGAASIQTVGGLTALAVTWILGPAARKIFR